MDDEGWMLDVGTWILRSPTHSALLCSALPRDDSLALFSLPHPPNHLEAYFMHIHDPTPPPPPHAPALRAPPICSPFQTWQPTYFVSSRPACVRSTCSKSLLYCLHHIPPLSTVNSQLSAAALESNRLLAPSPQVQPSNDQPHCPKH